MQVSMMLPHGCEYRPGGAVARDEISFSCFCPVSLAQETSLLVRALPRLGTVRCAAA